MMSGLSRSARRATRRSKRRRKGELNIVSMIDILTVLVFFLLVNSTGVSVLSIDLPDANASPLPDRVPLQLSVILRSSGLRVATRGTVLKSFPNASNGDPDLTDVAHLLREIKSEEPSETTANLLVEPGVEYNTIVQVMDVVRVQPTNDGLGEQNLFPQMSLGDAPDAPLETP